MDCNAGWRAKTNVPIPITVVKAEKKMAVLCEFSNCRPVRYLFCNPSIMKNAEIIPDSKNKSGQNDVDDIELNTQYAH